MNTLATEGGQPLALMSKLERKFIAVCAGKGQKHTTRNKDGTYNQNKYVTKTFAEIVATAINPPSLPKEQNWWVIPSLCNDRDARSSTHQKSVGRYPFLWFDSDGLNADGSCVELDQIKTVFNGLCCLVYSTASSKPSHKKWRILLLCDRDLTPEEFVGTTLAVNKEVGLAGLSLDEVNARPAQIMYLPNRGEHYEYWQSDDDYDGRLCQPVAGFHFPTKKEYEASDKDPTTVIGRFNSNVSVTEALERCGYTHQGGDRWLPPNSTSGVAGISVLNDRWVSMHDSMRNAGIGSPNPSGSGCTGDAFDLFKYHYCRNDERLALREATKLYPIDITALSGVDLSDFSLAAKITEEPVAQSKKWELFVMRAGDPKEWDTSRPFECLDDVNAYFNAQYVTTLFCGKFRIARWTNPPAYPRQKVYEFLERRTLDDYHASVKLEVIDEKGKVKRVPAFRAWLEGGGAKSYNGTEFDPEQATSPLTLNTYSGLAIEPVRGDCSSILRHLYEVIASGDKSLYDYIIGWMALFVQKPWVVHEVTLVVRGEEGTGKGLIGRLLCDIAGAYGVNISNPKHLVGNFNAALANRLFMFADEAFYAKDKQHENILKALLTNPTLFIEKKGLDGYEQQNYLTIYMATNSDYAVPAGKSSRRFCVVDASSLYLGNREYFTTLRAFCKSIEGRAAFLDYLLNVDLTGYEVRQIPSTQALKEQREHSLDSVEEWLADCLEFGGFEGIGMNPTDAQPWDEVMLAKDVYASFMYWCDKMNRGKFDKVSQTMFGRRLTKMGFLSDLRHCPSINRTANVRLMKNLDEAREVFKTYTGT